MVSIKKNKLEQYDTSKFDNWCGTKKETHFLRIAKKYRTRDIWWVNLGVNIGNEEDGKGELYLRPVVIVTGLSATTCLVAPLTTSDNIHKFRIDVGDVDGKQAKAIISQIKVLDTKRFVEKVGFVSKEKFEDIRKAVKNLI